MLITKTRTRRLLMWNTQHVPEQMGRDEPVWTPKAEE
jgi:hypothetical protein